MLPLFNPFLETTPPASQQQVPQPNPGSHVNPSNMLPNPLQMGMLNPQSSIPFIPSMPNQFGFMPLQNNHLGMPQMPHLGSAQSHLGSFNTQNCVQNIGQAAYQSNPSQPPPNLFGNSSANLPVNFPFCMPNLNQNFPLSMPNLNQVGPYNVLQQLAQALGPQNAFLANQQFRPQCVNGVGENVHQANNHLGPPMTGSNALKQPPLGTQQLQGNRSTMATSSVQPQQNWKNQQPSNFMKSQGNLVKDVGFNNSNSNWKNSPYKNFSKNPKGNDSDWGFRKSQSHHLQNARGTAGISNRDRGKGWSNMAGNFCHPNVTYQDKKEKRRPVPLNYPEQEIRNWREERKKNYPSKANLEKKLAAKLMNSEVIEAEAKSRRQQLREILAKQAELGVEVAEIPPDYLLDSEKQEGHGKEESNKKAFGKKERFQNKGNKRRRHGRRQWQRHDQEDRLTKKRRLGNDSGDVNASNQPPLNNKKQTLLQKLLSTDIKRDERHLLQVFRFMVMNSFFKDWPEKPLKFPLVEVKDIGCQSEVVALKSSPAGNDGVSQGSKRVAADLANEDDDADDAQAKETCQFGKVEGGEIERSEEGEIID